MFKDEFQAVANAGKAKRNLMKNNPVGYFIAAMLAGMFVGFGALISQCIGYAMTAAGAAGAVKITTAFVFASALSLVVMAGSELFTGNNFVMASASMKKEVPWSDTIKLWIFCYIGNLVGSFLIAVLFHFTKVPTGDLGAYFANTAATKASGDILDLFFKGIMCNICVCLAVWCGTKMKSESGKLIMITWCIMIFMVCTFRAQRCQHDLLQHWHPGSQWSGNFRKRNRGKSDRGNIGQYGGRHCVHGAALLSDQQKIKNRQTGRLYITASRNAEAGKIPLGQRRRLPELPRGIFYAVGDQFISEMWIWVLTAQ